MIGSSLRDPAELGVHLVIVGVVGLYGEEGASADMQREHRAPDSGDVQGVDEPRGEMQRGRGGSNRPFLCRKHRLVILQILRVDAAFAGDVRRQRHGASTMEQHFDRLLAFEQQRDRTVGMAFLRDGGHPAAEDDLVAQFHPLGIADEGLPAPEVHPLVQGRANLRFPVSAAAFELGGDHAGIVEHQHIAGTEQRGQILDAAILKRSIAPTHHQHPRRIARADGTQRNALGRQFEIEQVYLHGRGA